MKQQLCALGFASLMALSAKADIIRCNFTEPFVSTIYSMTQSTLTYDDHSTDPATVTVIKNVSFQILGKGKFELWSSNNQVLQKLNLNFSGSDGMSDNVYPYTVKDTKLSNSSNLGNGGCRSNFLQIEMYK